MLHRLRRHASPPAANQPQILSFVREPLARCRSHFKCMHALGLQLQPIATAWRASDVACRRVSLSCRYEHALCRRTPLGMHAPYCNGIFLPKYATISHDGDHLLTRSRTMEITSSHDLARWRSPPHNISHDRDHLLPALLVAPSSSTLLAPPTPPPPDLLTSPPALSSPPFLPTPGTAVLG